MIAHALQSGTVEAERGKTAGFVATLQSNPHFISTYDMKMLMASSDYFAFCTIPKQNSYNSSAAQSLRRKHATAELNLCSNMMTTETFQLSLMESTRVR
jgi:hypothetical protein